MGDSSSVDLATLVEHEIPEGRQNLENSYSNLVFIKILVINA